MSLLVLFNGLLVTGAGLPPAYAHPDVPVVVERVKITAEESAAVAIGRTTTVKTVIQ